MRLKQSQREEILQRYLGGEKNTSALAALYGVDQSTIQRTLKRFNVKVEKARKYSLNQNFFNVINDENSAYILGFFYADGYNLEEEGFACMGLQERDGYILEKISNIIGSNRPLSFIKNKKFPIRQHTYKISINSKQISMDLSRLGCMQRKTLLLKFPTSEQVPNNLLRHFIRGYFDGNGSISKHIESTNRKYTFRISMVSTENFCLNLSKYIKEHLEINSSIRTSDIYKNDITRILCIYGNRQIYKFLKWIYGDSNIHLNRKMEKFVDLANQMI